MTKLIRGLHNLKDWQRGAALSIGKFDALHLGHQQLLQAISHYSKQQQYPSGLIIFHPYPEDFFHNQYQARISSTRNKLQLLQHFGIDFLLCLRFDQTLATQSPRQFIQQVLVKQLCIRKLWIGNDFRFGNQRQGDFTLLTSAAATNGFSIEQIQDYRIEQHKASSSRIRQLIKKGDMTQAAQFMGRYFSISSQVVHGKKIGRQLGFATANLNLANAEVNAQARLLATGVYAVMVKIKHHHGLHIGVCNVGYKPTLATKQLSIEVHLFNFDADIYQQRLNCWFIEKIRDEQSFDNLNQLQQQIQRDCERTAITLTPTRIQTIKSYLL